MILNMCSEFVNDSAVNSGVAGKMWIVNVPLLEFAQVFGIVCLNVFNMSISHCYDNVGPGH
jgi:hypothetical protein